jgi:hypothetical protein
MLINNYFALLCEFIIFVLILILTKNDFNQTGLFCQ